MSTDYLWSKIISLYSEYDKAGFKKNYFLRIKYTLCVSLFEKQEWHLGIHPTLNEKICLILGKLHKSTKKYYYGCQFIEYRPTVITKIKKKIKNYFPTKWFLKKIFLGKKSQSQNEFDLFTLYNCIVIHLTFCYISFHIIL